MSIKLQNELESELTDTLALAICMQTSEDFAYLTSKYGKSRRLYKHNYKLGERLISKEIKNDRNAHNLACALLRNYTKYVTILESRKYG